MIYLLHGEEHYLIKREIKRLIDKYVTYEKEMNTMYYDATKTSMEEIIADAYTLPFFSEYKAIIVQNAMFLSTGNSTDTNIELINKYLSNPNETTLLIFVLEDANLDNRKKLVKQLIAQATVLKFSQFNDFERNKFIEKELKNRKISFTNEALQEFNYRVGYSAQRILTELDKISVYSNHIEKEDVIALVIRPLEENVFDVFNYLIRKDFKKAYSLWKDLDALNIDSITLIANLASQYRFLLQVYILYNQGLNQNEITKELSAHYYRVQKNLELLHYVNEKEMMEKLNLLATLDQRIKAGLLDKRQGFELFLIKETK